MPHHTFTDSVFSGISARKLFTKPGLFPQSNIQVTSGTPKQARSESIIAVNPGNRRNLIASSKKFSNPQTYRFTIGVRVSYDGGDSWQDSSLPTLQEWDEFAAGGILVEQAGMTDPAVAFDDFGNAFMVGEPLRYKDRFGEELETIGMYIYKSTDGGLHWSQPVPLHVGDKSDDKSWIACDNNLGSPYYGHVYVAWGAVSPLRFARSTDHGQSWKGIGTQAPGSQLVAACFAPEISVGLDGTVHIAWFFDGEDSAQEAGTTIEYMRSTNGGETFEAQKSIVSGVHGLRGNLPETANFPHFRGATFRVITLATGCGFGIDPLSNSRFSFPFIHGPKHFIVAWSDYRQGAARIFYRTSSDAGASFEGPESGQPLLNRQVDLSVHHFHPQIVCTGSGVIGCAFYEYRFNSENGPNLIDVKLSASFDKGQTFSYTTTVTDKPWDPKIDAPFSHGHSQLTFIGEYFGLDADDNSFDVLWTDTRTGVQELFFARVATGHYDPPDSLQGIIAQILFGIIEDGYGVIIVNGHIHRVPPTPGPEYDLLQALAALDAASKISGPAGRTLVKNVYASIGAIADTAGKSLKV